MLASALLNTAIGLQRVQCFEQDVAGDNKMRKAFKYILSIFGLAYIILFCVSATVSIAGGPDIYGATFSKPAVMLLIGIGFIGLSGFVRNKRADS